MKCRYLVTLLLLSMVGMGAANQPRTYTWIATAPRDWLIADNWSPFGVPQGADTAVITNGNVLLSRDVTVSALALSGGTITVPSGRVLTVTNFTWTGGTLGGTNNIAPGGLLTISGNNDKTLAQATLNISGNAVWTGLGRIRTTGNVVINVSPAAIFEAQSPSALERRDAIDPLPLFVNQGTVRKSGDETTTTFQEVNFGNLGTVEVQRGKLSFAFSSFSNRGQASVVNGILELGGGGASDGNFQVEAGATLSFTRGLHQFLQFNLTNSGQVIFNGADINFLTNLTVTAPVTLADGRLIGTNEIAFESLTWTGGEMSGGGVTVVPPGATMVIDGEAEKRLSDRNLNNSGSVLWSGSGLLSASGAQFHNLPGGLLDIRSDAIFSLSNPSNALPSLLNDGTVIKTAGAGTTLVSNVLVINNAVIAVESGTLNFTALTNAGSMQARSGLLSLSGESSHAGTLDILAGATAEMSGLSHAFQTASVVSGTGRLVFGGGTVDMQGNNIISSATEVTGGTVNFASTNSFGSTSAPLLIEGGEATINVNATREAVSLSAGALSGTGQFLVASGGQFTWTGGEMRGTGSLGVLPGGVLLITGNSTKTLNGRTINNGGATVWNGQGELQAAANPATFNNQSGGFFEAQTSAAFVGDGHVTAFNNFGSFLKTGADTTNVFVGTAFNNQGTVVVEEGTLDLAAGGRSGGRFHVAPPAWLKFSGGLHGLVGANLSGPGQILFNGATVNLETRTVALGPVTMTGGLLSGADIVFNALEWAGGEMRGPGNTLVSAGGSLVIQGDLDKTLNGRTIVNSGNISWSGAGNLLGSGASSGINNQTGALFHVRSTARLARVNNLDPPMVFDNFGFFSKSGDATETTLDGIAFNNSGEIRLLGGSLHLSSGTFTNGNIVQMERGRLRLDGDFVSEPSGTLRYIISGSTPQAQFGQIEIAGKATLNGKLTVALQDPFTPANSTVFELMKFDSYTGNFAEITGLTLGTGLRLNPVLTAKNLTLVTSDQRPVLTPPIRGEDGTVRLTLSGFAGKTYVVETSSDLRTWAPLLTNSIPTAVLEFTDTGAADLSARFYRAAEQP